MADDPFPRDRLGAMVRRMPAYLRLSWHLAREPLLSKARRLAVVGAAGYLVSPVDLVPGVVPVLGQLDDIAVALAAIRLALAGLSPEQRQRHLSAVGLGDEHLVEDLRTLGATTAWLGRAGYRTTRRVASTGTRTAQAGAGIAVRATRIAADRATPAAKAVAGRAGAAAPAAAARVTPAARATGRIVRDTGTKVVGAGGRAANATGSLISRMPRRRGRADPEILVTEVDLPLLPPPPPRRID